MQDRTRERLDGYWAGELGCRVSALHDGGVTLCAPAHRDGPRWMGWLVPIEVIALSDTKQGTGVISTTPTLLHPLRRFLDNRGEPMNLLPPEGWGLWPFIHQTLPEVAPKIHQVHGCDAGTFAPAADVFPVSEVHDDDPRAPWFRYRFDGPVFAARGASGAILSWAAIKCKSCDVWEMAVVTEEPYRNMGLARSVVSHATRAALDAGKVALYLHDVQNTPSAHVCRAVGFQPYAHELTCEAGRVPMREAGLSPTRPAVENTFPDWPFI